MSWLIKTSRQALELLGIKFVEAGGAVGAFAPHFVGFADEIEAEEFFAEVAFVELAAKYDFVGSLQLAEGKCTGQKRRDGVGISEFGDQALVSIPDDGGVVVGEFG